MNRTELKGKALRQKRLGQGEVDLRGKALLVIESLTMGDFKPNDKVIEACYKYAHVARGHCENPHEDWKQELERVYEREK